jgi:Fe-S-cluster-containing hydrogenase component 2
MEKTVEGTTMVILFWSTNNELKRVPGGKKLNLKCLRCNQQANFYECLVDESLKAYWVVELWKKSKRVLQCGECLGVCDYYQVFPDEKALAEQAEAAQKQKLQEAEAKRKQEAEQVQQHQHELESQKREEERKRKELEVEDELQQLKRKLGK